MLKTACVSGLLGVSLLVTARQGFAGPQLVQAKPFCALQKDKLLVQSIVEIDYKYSGSTATRLKKATEHSRVLWSISCDLPAGECCGLSLKLDSIDKGEAIGLFDTACVKGMTVAGRTGKVVTLTWGPYRTLTLDMGSRKLEYRESSDDMEGRGVGPCDGGN
jgi:hypothetical protein